MAALNRKRLALLPNLDAHVQVSATENALGKLNRGKGLGFVIMTLFGIVLDKPMLKTISFSLGVVLVVQSLSDLPADGTAAIGTNTSATTQVGIGQIRAILAELERSNGLANNN